MGEFTEAVTEDQAAAQINALLAEPEAKKPEKVLPPRGEKGKFTKAEKEEEPGPYLDEEKEPEADAEPEPEPEGDEEKPEVRLVKVKVDGMEVEVDEEELKKGYSRQTDYTKKTQALAEERRKFEAEERAAVRQERREYAERLERVHEALEALTPSREPDWMEMQQQGMTPDEFTKHYASWKANRDRMEKVEMEHARVRALQEQESQKDRAKRLAAEQERLVGAIPELQDPEKGKVLRQDLVDYAKSIGFSDDDLAGVEDHRPLVLLHKARLWDESQKRRPKVEEKVDRAIEAMKPSGAKPAPRQKVVDGLKNRLSTSGSVEDAAKLLDTMGFK